MPYISTWTTRDGDVIPISSMSNKHIENCITMLKRQVKQALKSYYLSPESYGELSRIEYLLKIKLKETINHKKLIIKELQAELQTRKATNVPPELPS